MYYIYMHQTDYIDEGIYIGQTKNEPSKRWYDKWGRCAYKSGKFGKKLEVCPFEWWEHIVIKSGVQSAEEADILETMYILQHNSVRQGCNSNYGRGLKYIGWTREEAETDPAAAIEKLKEELNSLTIGAFEI